MQFFWPTEKYWYEVCHQDLFAHPGQVVTEFQFSASFANASTKGMTIANVTSGLHGTGIYPFSPRMIMDKFQAESNSSSQPSTDHVVATYDSQSGAQSDSTRSLFKADLTPEMIELYKRRLQNGYDIYTDTSYVAWLEKNTFHLLVICQYFKNFLFLNCRCDNSTTE